MWRTEWCIGKRIIEQLIISGLQGLTSSVVFFNISIKDDSFHSRTLTADIMIVDSWQLTVDSWRCEHCTFIEIGTNWFNQTLIGLLHTKGDWQIKTSMYIFSQFQQRQVHQLSTLIWLSEAGDYHSTLQNWLKYCIAKCKVLWVKIKVLKSVPFPPIARPHMIVDHISHDVAMDFCTQSDITYEWSWIWIELILALFCASYHRVPSMYLVLTPNERHRILISKTFSSPYLSWWFSLPIFDWLMQKRQYQFQRWPQCVSKLN